MAEVAVLEKTQMRFAPIAYIDPRRSTHTAMPPNPHPMKDQETVQRFIQLRAAGWSYHRIAAEINVSKPTLIHWSRQHQTEIQNLRALETEALADRCFAPREQRWSDLGAQLRRIEAELAQRDLSKVPTSQLISLASRLRAEASRQAGELRLTSPTKTIPHEEFFDSTIQWPG
jgi:hypothetical protein